MLVRDYGLYDHAMLRFTPGHKLADSFYVRQDGTRAYYFSTGKLTVANNAQQVCKLVVLVKGYKALKAVFVGTICLET